MTYLILFLTFMKIGAFTFGGGYAMLPLIQEEVIGKAWMQLDQLVNFIAVSESTPGPFAVNISTFVGTELGGLAGAACATLGVILPSFVIIVIVAKYFMKFSDNPYVEGCMTGLRPAVVGMIGSALISVGRSVFFPGEISLSVLLTPEFLLCAVIFTAMLLLVMKKIHPVIIILISAAAGIAAGYAFGL